MVAQDRRSGSRSWIPGLLATFWVVLAGLSGAYLYYIFTNPDARRVERALASQGTPQESADAAGGPRAPRGVSAEEAAALTDAIAAKDREIATLKSEIHDLSSQVAAFDGRLKPIERVLGPVAALPSSTAVTTSPPPGTPVDTAPAAKPVEAPKPTPPAAAPKPPEAAPPQPAVAAPKPAEPAEPAATPPGQAASAPKPVEPVTAPAEETAAVAAPEPPMPTEKPSDRTAAPAVPAEDAGEASAPAGAPDQAAEEPGAQDQSAEPSAPAEAATDTPAMPASPGSDSEVAALTAPNIPPGTTRFGIELGTVDKQDGIRPMWRNLLTNHAALVAGLQARRIIAPDKKWRLIAGPFSSAAEALQACALFKKANMPCEATVFAGDAL
jgi:hypothetical protein